MNAVLKDFTMKREQIDFHIVYPKHHRIHELLLNWARWVDGRAAAQSSPMFRLYRSSAWARAEVNDSKPVDSTRAVDIAKALANPTFPPPHRGALNWCYLRPVNPSKACRELGTNMPGLMQLVHDGRQILVNRGFGENNGDS